MNEEENYLPWANYKNFYELSKEDFDKLGSKSCFRVRCKLCEPALKTIGTNRTSSSNLRKHLKSVHPQELTKLETFGVGRRRREHHEESEWKNRKLRKMEDFQEAERDLLCQLVDEYQEMVDERPTEAELLAKKRKGWESLTVAFNEAAIGVKRTTDQLRNFWEGIKKKREKKDDDLQGTPCSIVSAIYSTPKSAMVIPHITYTAQNMWDSAMVDSEEQDGSENRIDQPIVIASLRNEDSCSNHEIDCSDQPPSNCNGIQGERKTYSRAEKAGRGSLSDGKRNEEKVDEQRVQSHNLRMEEELRMQMLKDEMEHKRRMMSVELSHRKLLNSLERKMREDECNMKREAFVAEERRKEERHKLELSLLGCARAETSVVSGNKKDESQDNEREAAVLQRAESTAKDKLLANLEKHVLLSPSFSEELDAWFLGRKKELSLLLSNKEDSSSSQVEEGTSDSQNKKENSAHSGDKQKESSNLLN